MTDTREEIGTVVIWDGGTASVRACPYCGSFHTTLCPLIKRIEYHPNGTIKSVELYRG